MGSAALFYAASPRKALLTDINEDLVNTFIAVRDHPRAVHNRLAKIKGGKRAYLSLRRRNPVAMTRLDRAARFIYLNRFCFNGLYRTNQGGQFNVPYSGTKTGQVPPWQQLALAAKALSTAEIACTDFEEVLLDRVRAGDFVYLDPPYALANRRVFRQYDSHSFGLEDLDRLAAALRIVNSRGAHFVLSYAVCAEGLASFGSWPSQMVFCQRNISGFAKHRRRAAEMIISNLPRQLMQRVQRSGVK